MIAMPQQVVLQQGTECSALYFVNRGRLTVAGASGEQIDSLKDNDFFGEEGLIYDTRSKNTVTASDYCDLMYAWDASRTRRLVHAQRHSSHPAPLLSSTQVPHRGLPAEE